MERHLFPKPLVDRYLARLRRAATRGPLPRHVGLVMDGNRRWARQRGMEDPGVGHRYGGAHIEVVLSWCREVGIDHVTVYLASVDNLRKRDADEVDHLLDVIDELVATRHVQPYVPWRVHVAGRLDTLRPGTARALTHVEEETRERATNGHLTLAVGYDGHLEVVDAVRSLLDSEARAGTTLRELADRVTGDLISTHLDNAGRPNPDLIIRTSGELRLSGFLLWQSTRSDLYFCDAYWPDCRHGWSPRTAGSGPGWTRRGRR